MLESLFGFEDIFPNFIEVIISFTKNSIYLEITPNSSKLTRFFESYVVSRISEEIEIKEEEHIITKTISFSDMNEDLLIKLLSDEI